MIKCCKASSFSPKTASCKVTLEAKGKKLLSRYRNIKECPDYRMFSANKDPLVPLEKFYIVLTVFFYRGTDVPPLVTKNNVLTFRSKCWINYIVFSLIAFKEFNSC